MNKQRGVVTRLLIVSGSLAIVLSGCAASTQSQTATTHATASPSASSSSRPGAVTAAPQLLVLMSADAGADLHQTQAGPTGAGTQPTGAALGFQVVFSDSGGLRSVVSQALLTKTDDQADLLLQGTQQGIQQRGGTSLGDFAIGDVGHLATLSEQGKFVVVLSWRNHNVVCELLETQSGTSQADLISDVKRLAQLQNAAINKAAAPH